MRIVDIIEKKKRNMELTSEEIKFFITSLTNGSMPDYQAAAWLMAVWFNGMSEDETAILTQAMIDSGDRIDFGDLTDKIVDKHSTGGVGDKVTITLIPLLAAAGIPIAKLSGKGLGHTGGTIDKLESVPGFSCNLTVDELISQVKQIGLVIGQQTMNLTPADGILYSLRDVTATVDAMPLIASSVVSKKIASGAGHIILDVKYGSGAFMKTPEKAIELAKLMVKTGKKLNKPITAVVTAMDEPLGQAVGNSLEIIEAVEFLKGHKVSRDISELTYDFGVIALLGAKMFNNEKDAREYLEKLITSSKALEKFRELIVAQGGNPDVIEDYSKFEQAKFKIEVSADVSGYIEKTDAFKVAYGCKLLGAGREKKNDKIDPSVGVFLNKKTGEKVETGDILFTMYANDKDRARECEKYCRSAYTFTDTKPQQKDLIYGIVRP